MGRTAPDFSRCYQRHAGTVSSTTPLSPPRQEISHLRLVNRKRSLTLDSGLKFIWIDALCIVQESEDWTIEAGHMASVYGGAFVSLAASSAYNVHHGFLQRPKPYNGGFSARVTTSTLCRVRRFFDRHEHDDSVYRSKLAGRAWALQEKLLPARTIHFCDTGLWWECRSQLSTEYLPDPLTGLSSASSLMRPVHKPWPWPEIVWHYARASLSYGTDRLPALSGIASRQHEITGDQYLAGMWKKSLIYQLVWRVQDTVRSLARPEWRAPSWSWASIEGGIKHYSGHIVWIEGRSKDNFVHNEYIRVLTATTTPSGPDPFGQVDSGELTISCSHLVRGHLGRADAPADVTGYILLDAGLGVFPVEIDYWEDALFKGEGNVYLLPVFRGKSGMAQQRGLDHIDELLLCGLVVEACGNCKGQFRRVGCFQFLSVYPWEEDKEDYFQEFLKVLEKVGDSVAAAECARTLSSSDGEEERRYVITLV